jgi:hypothetical protein
MKKAAFISIFLVLTHFANAQFVFETFFKQGAVAVGEPFRIQYVLEDRSDIEFFPPDFSGFRMVNQPSVYGGVTYGAGEPKNLKNIIYTLEAIKPGRYTIAAASARMGNQLEKSDNVIVEVISKAEAAMRNMKASMRESNNAAYYLAPDEDPQEKIRRNLFLKVLVDKKKCFVGEPVTATFKLYSRLISRSDIVKNPGFYGFTVQDVIGLGDNQSAIETINGNRFDVHTVRKVQLYPLHEGEYTIDPMEVVTKVDFSRSIVNRKTEQEIKEGVFAENEAPAMKGVETFETTMSSASIPVIVKPAPVKNRPPDYGGATGNFSISAIFNKKELGKNEQGELVVTVSGKGNFTQLASPVIKWPEELEVFDARVKDELDHKHSPMKGKRTFHIPFLSAMPGTFTVPSIQFSFFDPDSNRYKTIMTQPAVITVSTKENPVEKAVENKKSVRHDYTGTLLAFLLLLMIAVGAAILWRRKLQEANAQKLAAIKEPLPPAVLDLLKPAFVHLNAGSKEFYTVFRQCIWNFFSIYLGLKGSGMSRFGLIMAMNEKGIETPTQQTILEILEDCETGIFADVDMQGDRKGLLDSASQVLEKIQESATARKE